MPTVEVGKLENGNAGKLQALSVQQEQQTTQWYSAKSSKLNRMTHQPYVNDSISNIQANNQQSVSEQSLN